MTQMLNFNCRHNYATGFRLDIEFNTEAAVTAIFGPSGSGKTTTLSLIAGLLRPDEGQIVFGSRVLTDTKARRFVPPEQRELGMLFQDNCLFPHMTVRGNIEYGVRRRTNVGVSTDRVVETLELSDLLQRYPNSLSGGQKQRVALARAIASSPKLLLLDEPLTAVERPLQEKIATFIERVINEFEIPTLLVSHNRALVDRLASKVIQLEDGMIAG